MLKKILVVCVLVSIVGCASNGGFLRSPIQGGESTMTKNDPAEDN